MILQDIQTESELLALISGLKKDLAEGCGIAAFYLSIIYSPGSVIPPRLKNLIHPSDSIEQEFVKQSIPLLRKQAKCGNSTARAILDIYQQSNIIERSPEFLGRVDKIQPSQNAEKGRKVSGDKSCNP
jgi:hypothetical protein